MKFIKICGVTTLDDLDVVIGAGANAVGFNMWSCSPRAIDEQTARILCDRARGRIETVLVVVNHPDAEGLRERVGADWVQLHGDEAPQDMFPRSFKAVGLASAEDVREALMFPGERLLVDARDPLRRGGTGERVPQELAREVVRERSVILAGGLRPENVAQAVRRVRPWGVDTASGVESSPGRKDAERVKRFVEAAQQAAPDGF